MPDLIQPSDSTPDVIVRQKRRRSPDAPNFLKALQREEILRRRDAGETYGELADAFGVTRQAVHQLCKRTREGKAVGKRGRKKRAGLSSLHREYLRELLAQKPHGPLDDTTLHGWTIVDAAAALKEKFDQDVSRPEIHYFLLEQGGLCSPLYPPGAQGIAALRRTAPRLLKAASVELPEEAQRAPKPAQPKLLRPVARPGTGTAAPGEVPKEKGKRGRKPAVQDDGDVWDIADIMRVNQETIANLNERGIDYSPDGLPITPSYGVRQGKHKAQAGSNRTPGKKKRR
jgi:transposase